MTLDHSGRALLLDLQQHYDAPAFQDVPDVTGEDPDHRIGVRIDAACRIQDLTVLLVDQLRTSEDVSAAVEGAYTDADAQRVLASLEVSGATAEYEREGAALIADGLRLRRTPDELRARHRSSTSSSVSVVSSVLDEVDHAGRSDNGYVAVSVSAAGRPVQVDVDVEYLLGATAARLQEALLQAFRAADARVSEVAR